MFISSSGKNVCDRHVRSANIARLISPFLGLYTEIIFDSGWPRLSAGNLLLCSTCGQLCSTKTYINALNAIDDLFAGENGSGGRGGCTRHRYWTDGTAFDTETSQLKLVFGRMKMKEKKTARFDTLSLGVCGYHHRFEVSIRYRDTNVCMAMDHYTLAKGETEM